MLQRNSLLLSFIFFGIGIFLTNYMVECIIVKAISTVLIVDLDVKFRSLGLFYCGVLLFVLSFILACYYLSNKNILTQKQFFYSSSASLIVFYFFFLFRDAVNIPITDDYGMLMFLTDYVHAETLMQKWQLLYEPVNECRIIIPKLFFLAAFKISGSINFFHMVLANACALLLLCYLLFKSVNTGKKEILLLGFLFFILQFQGFDLAFWSSSGICHYWVLIFMFLTVTHLWSDKRNSFFYAMLFALLTAFTFGNGLLVFPFGVALLWMRNKRMHALLFAVLMSMVLVLYFYHWSHPRNPWHFNPLLIFVYATGFLGSSMQFMYSIYIPVLAGLFILYIFVYSTLRKYYQTSPVAWSLLLIIITTAFMTAPLRIDMGTPLQSRYSIYSVAAIVLAIIMIRDLIFKSNETLSKYVLIGGICYSFLSGIMFYPEAPFRTERIANFVNAWKNGNPLTYAPTGIPFYADVYLDNAINARVWAPPDNIQHHLK